MDARVSRRHCQLRIDRHSIWLNDLDSTNGTFVNQRRIERCELAPGDSINVGDSSLRVVLKDSAEWAAHLGRIADRIGRSGAHE
jgi:pSer/pThr/pTyr-binding forkhead associated (FHA) protein